MITLVDVFPLMGLGVQSATMVLLMALEATGLASSGTIPRVEASMMEAIRARDILDVSDSIIHLTPSIILWRWLLEVTYILVFPFSIFLCYAMQSPMQRLTHFVC